MKLQQPSAKLFAQVCRLASYASYRLRRRRRRCCCCVRRLRLGFGSSLCLRRCCCCCLFWLLPLRSSTSSSFVFTSLFSQSYVVFVFAAAAAEICAACCFCFCYLFLLLLRSAAVLSAQIVCSCMNECCLVACDAFCFKCTKARPSQGTTTTKLELVSILWSITCQRL